MINKVFLPGFWIMTILLLVNIQKVSAQLIQLQNNNVQMIVVDEDAAEEPAPVQRPTPQKRKTETKTSQPANDTKTKSGKKLSDLTENGIVEPALIDQTIKDLDLIEENLSRYDNKPFQKQDHKDQVLFKIDSIGLQLYHHGNNQQSRVLAFHLIGINLKDKPVEIAIKDFKLDESGKILKIEALPATVKNYAISVAGDRSESLNKFDENKVLKIPPQGIARVFVAFNGLDQGNHIPKLNLQFMLEGNLVDININRQELGILNLTKKYLGPEKCLLYLKVTGQTNMINTGCLIDELDDASTKSITRAVIEWADTATRFDNQCQNWIRYSLEHHYSPNNWSNDQYPNYPSNIKELHLAFTAKDDFFKNYGSNNFSDRCRIYVHQNSIEALSTAIRSAIEILTHDQLLEMLESKEPASVASVLAFAGHRLNVEDLDLILPNLKNDETLVVTSTLSALSHIDHPDSLKALITAVSDSRKEIANIAILSLSTSRIPQYQLELQKIYDTSSQEIQQLIVRQISTSPHPQWIHILKEQFHKQNTDLRVEALKALGQIDPDDILDILKIAIKDPDQRIWDTALRLLSNINGNTAENLLLEKTREQLKLGNITDNMLNVISQTRDPQLQTLLFEYWKAKGSKSNSRVLNELMKMLDPEILKELTKRYNDYSENEKSNFIRNFPLDFGDYDDFIVIWKDGLLSNNSSLNNASQEVFRKNPSEQMFDIIVKALEEPEIKENRVSNLCNLLYQYGTPEARQALREFRDKSTNEQFINYAENSLRNMYQNTPCYYFLYNAKSQNDNGTYTLALKQLDVAIQVDADIPDFYLERARSRIGLGNMDKAIEDYNKVIEIEPKHKTAWALMADAYVEQRDFKKAIEVLNKALALRPADVGLWTSRGHAYAMLENFNDSLSNYQKALELEPKNPQAITGVSLAETSMGKYLEGVDRIIKNKKDHAKDNLYAYNSACVYSRALEQLLKVKDPDENQKKLIGEYQQQGIKELKDSVELGFINDEWISKDPDLVFLARDDNQAFKDIVSLAKEKRAAAKKKKKGNEEE